MSLELFYFAIALGLVPILLLLIKRKKINQRTLLILPFLCLVVVGDIYEVTGQLLRFNSEYWFRIYALLEPICLGYYFYLLLNRKYKLFFIICLSGYLAFYISLFFYWTPKVNSVTDGYLHVLYTIFIFCFAFLWFKGIFDELRETSLLNVPDFYFVSGLLLYLGSSLFMFLTVDLMDKDPNINSDYYWNLIIICNIILRIFLITGVWKAKINTSVIRNNVG